MKIDNPYQAHTPLGQAISNLGAAIFSGPTPAEAESQRLKNELLRAQTASAGSKAAAANAANRAQVDLGTLFGQVPEQRRATLAPVADPGVAGPARALAATTAEDTRGAARQFLDDYADNVGAAAAPLVSSPKDLGDLLRVVAANSPHYSDNDVVRAMAGAGNAIGVNEAVSLPGQDRVRADNSRFQTQEDLAKIAATPLSESQVRGAAFAGLPADRQAIAVGPTNAEVQGNSALNTIAANPEDERIHALGAQAFGAPTIKLADPTSSTGVREVPRNFATDPNLDLSQFPEGVPPSAASAQDVTGVTSANRTAAQRGLGDIGTTRALIGEVEWLADPSFFGTTGFMKQTVQNLSQQGSAFGEFLNGRGFEIQNKVQGDNMVMGPDQQLNPALFDPNLPAFQFLKNLLVYRLALINNPDGRISTPDFVNAERNMGGQTGLFSLSNEAQFRSNLRAFGLLLDSEERKFNSQLQGNFAGSAQAPAQPNIPPPPPGFEVQ
jgi:hypothetical protein